MRRRRIQHSNLLMLPAVMFVFGESWARADRQPADGLTCASTRDHLWFVIEDQRELWLCHHADAMAGPYYRAQTKLSIEPSAIAAWGERIWLVFPSSHGARESHREVFTVKADYNAAVDMYSVSPSGRLDAVDSLPGTGNLAGFVGTERGPVALLWPPQQAAATVTAGEHAQAAEDVLTQPQLLQLRGPHWVELGPPPSIHAPFGEVRLVADPDGSSLVLLTPSSQHSNRMVVHKHLAATGEWSETECAQDLRDLVGLISVGNQIAMAINDPIEKTILIGNLRPTAVIPIARLPFPSGGVALSGLGDRIQVLEKPKNSAIIVREIEPLSGVESSRAALVEQPVGYRLWQIGFLLAVLIASTLLVFLVRPVSQGSISLQSGLAPADLGVRLLAIAIDLLPGVLIMVLLFKVHPEELIYPPVLTTNLDQAIPYSLVALITVIHSVVAELMSDTTLGKSIFGIRVLSMDGARPRRMAILLRNLVKLVVMLVPPLALIIFLNPNMQGMGDLVARTIVVRLGESTEPQQRSDG